MALAAAGTKVRIANVTEAPIELAYASGAASKAGGPRPMASLRIEGGASVFVDGDQLTELKRRRVFVGFVKRGWLQVTSGDVVDVGA